MTGINYAEHLKHIGTGMSDLEKQEAIMNGIQNNIGFIFALLDELKQRVIVLEEKIKNELP